jgi:hypothetical protein
MEGGLDDTWTWDGSTWTQQHPAATPPGGAAWAAYDPTRRNLVLCVTGPAADAQTWVWDGTGWKQKHPATSPKPRLFASIAYDDAVGKVVLFGGKGVGAGVTGDATNELWLWDGANWEQWRPE